MKIEKKNILKKLMRIWRSVVRRKHVLFPVSLFFFVIAALTPVVVLTTYELSFRGRVYPGIKLSNAEQRINATAVRLTYAPTAEKQKEFVIQVSQLGVQVDWPKTRKKLLDVGRSGNFWDDVKTKIDAYRFGVAIDPILSYNSDLLDQTVSEISTSIDAPVVEPKFRLSGGRVAEFQHGAAGRVVDRSLLAKRVVAAVFSEGPEPTADIPVVIREPQATPGQKTAESMGIWQLLGRGISTYRGSIPSRKHNVALTSSKIDGTLVAPGAVFSFNETLGDVSQETGFQQAYVINEGRTILGDGGGVCQDSTTLFRAVLNAGLPVIERRAHSYRVGYYEQNSPPGFDATVYAPGTDFKFQNDTPAYLLIQAKADQGASTLTVELWGTGDGRVASVTKPAVTDVVAPPPDLYQDDPSLRSGQVKQVDWKAPGAKVTFSYAVTRGGQTIHEKTFVSLYRPWQAVFLRGTGG